MKTEMSDVEVVRILANRMGYDISARIPNGSFMYWSALRGPPLREMQFHYLDSTDALRPVLEKLTPKEWDSFFYSLLGNTDGSRWLSFEQLQYVLTLPPHTLAHAIAEVIEEGK